MTESHSAMQINEWLQEEGRSHAVYPVLFQTQTLIYHKHSALAFITFFFFEHSHCNLLMLGVKMQFFILDISIMINIFRENPLAEQTECRHQA